MIFVVRHQLRPCPDNVEAAKYSGAYSNVYVSAKTKAESLDVALGALRDSGWIVVENEGICEFVDDKLPDGVQGDIQQYGYGMVFHVWEKEDGDDGKCA